MSVLIPVYNAAPYIGEALDSVLAQTFTDYEVIVIDDGSTDAIEVAIAPYLDRIILIRQENLGVAAARNAAWRRARGRYLALLDADDAWMPQYLEHLVARLDADPDVGVIYPNAILFGDTPWAGKLHQDLNPSRAPVTFEGLLSGTCSVFVSALFRQELAKTVGGFDEALNSAEDFDLWLRMAQQGACFASTPEPLVRYRRRAGSLSSDEEGLLRNQAAVFNKIAADPIVTARQRDLAASQIALHRTRIAVLTAKRLLLAGDAASARAQLARASTFDGQGRLIRSRLALIWLAIGVAPRLVAWIMAGREASHGGKMDVPSRRPPPG